MFIIWRLNVQHKFLNGKCAVSNKLELLNDLIKKHGNGYNVAII